MTHWLADAREAEVARLVVPGDRSCNSAPGHEATPPTEATGHSLRIEHPRPGGGPDSSFLPREVGASWGNEPSAGPALRAQEAAPVRLAPGRPTALWPCRQPGAELDFVQHGVEVGGRGCAAAGEA